MPSKRLDPVVCVRAHVSVSVFRSPLAWPRPKAEPGQVGVSALHPRPCRALTQVVSFCRESLPLRTTWFVNTKFICDNADGGEGRLYWP